MSIKFPEIAKEWHPTLNDPLTPKDVTYGSSKVVWWQCPKNEKHTFEATVNSRTYKKGTNCPYCSGNKVSLERSLSVKFPEIAKEWHPTLNDPLTPKDFTYGSGKVVWWQCPKNEKHIWEQSINSRTQ